MNMLSFAPGARNKAIG